MPYVEGLAYVGGGVVENDGLSIAVVAAAVVLALLDDLGYEAFVIRV